MGYMGSSKTKKVLVKNAKNATQTAVKQSVCRKAASQQKLLSSTKSLLEKSRGTTIKKQAHKYTNRVLPN